MKHMRVAVAAFCCATFAGCVVSSTSCFNCKRNCARNPSCVRASTGAGEEIKYFDPHSHISGVLPYQAYANLPAFIKAFSDEGPGVTFEDMKRFYDYIEDTWYPDNKEKFDDHPYAPNRRYGLGARATLKIYSESRDENPAILSGALQRILTTTPFTEFDSAYAFRGDPGETYLESKFYNDSEAELSTALCKAEVLELGATDVTNSEQSVNFIGGWKFKNDRSNRLVNILCYGDEPRKLAPIFQIMDKPVPTVHVLLMTSSAELAQNANGTEYSSFAATGKCDEVPLAEQLKTNPEVIEHALLGENAQGKVVVPEGEMPLFWKTVVGIDTAGPEVTCFTDSGMDYYLKLVNAVYTAAKKRREQGWKGKLLVHTHVGEGFTVYYGREPPREPWTFDALFGELPDVSGNEISNPQVAQNNIASLLAALQISEEQHSDFHDYLVVRLGHVTWATPADAEKMAGEQLEADVNLDSNIATNAYPLSRMPASVEVKERAALELGKPDTNLQVNNFPAFTIPDPDDAKAVGDILGDSSLKYLLMAHVRVLLGSDSGGVEHSGMAREYKLGTSLIKFWNSHDPEFRKAAGALSEQTFFDNVNWHLENMKTDGYLPYH